jgi:hypothetical protein
MDNEAIFSDFFYFPLQPTDSWCTYIVISTCQQIAGVLEAENDGWNY